MRVGYITYENMHVLLSRSHPPVRPLLLYVTLKNMALYPGSLITKASLSRQRSSKTKGSLECAPQNSSSSSESGYSNRNRASVVGCADGI